MISFKRILFPVDFSSPCGAVVPSIQAMVKRFHAELIVLHVVDMPTATWYAPAEAAAWATLINADKLRDAGQVSLDRFIAQHLSDMPVVPRLLEGDPSEGIIDCAKEEHVDLIMMPTSGRGPFRRLLLGSVTAKILHDAHCPVWTGVHAGQLAAHPADRWKRVLCAIDTDDRDVRVLRWAAQFTADQQIELRLVHAVVGADSLEADKDPAMHAFLMGIARERIAKMQEEAGTCLEVCVLGGNIAQAVRQAVVGHDSDLIVIGRGVLQKPLGRLRSGAYSIIREAPCPVISI